MTLAKLAPVTLILALTACPAEDDGDDSTTNATTLSTSVSSTDPTGDSSGSEDPTGDPTTASTTMSTEESSTAPSDSSSSGGNECAETDECQDDTDCPGGGSCIDCICVGGEETGATMSDYGPCDACAGGETPIQIMGLEGCFCSPGCDGEGSMCPAPNDGTAMAMCLLGPSMMEPPENCVLICDLMNNNCPAGAMCIEAQPGIGICTHPVP